MAPGSAEPRDTHTVGSTGRRAGWAAGEDDGQYQMHRECVQCRTVLTIYTRSNKNKVKNKMLREEERGDTGTAHYLYTCNGAGWASKAPGGTARVRRINVCIRNDVQVLKR